MNREDYEKAWEIADQLIHSQLNEKSAGGLDPQLDQLYGNARLILSTLAEKNNDATFYQFINLIRKVRGDE